MRPALPHDFTSSSGYNPALHRVESWLARKNKIEATVNHRNASLTHFAYCVMNPEAAIAEDRRLESQLQTARHASPENQYLFEKYLRIKEANPSPATCGIVAIQGPSALAHRAAHVNAAYSKVLTAYEEVDAESKSLRTEAQRLRERMNSIRQRHIALTRQLVWVVNGIEKLALHTEIAEISTKSSLTNKQYYQVLQEFSWTKWEGKIAGLRSALCSLSSATESTPPKQDATGPSASIYYSFLSEACNIIKEQSQKIDAYAALCKQIEERTNLWRVDRKLTAGI